MSDLSGMPDLSGMDHPLDRPFWSALATRHARFAEGGPRARRYDPSIVPFAAAADDSEESRAALAALPRPGESMIFAEAGPVAPPPGFEVGMSAAGVQMLCGRAVEAVHDPRIRPLGPADAAAMLALATLTRPGPFTLRAQALGTFWGIEAEGRLVAMAGERLQVPGFSEASGLCTHPEFQGRGLGRLLLRHVTAVIQARGDTAFLHSFADNHGAIALYRRIGFELRHEVHFTQLLLPAEGENPAAPAPFRRAS